MEANMLRTLTGLFMAPLKGFLGGLSALNDIMQQNAGQLPSLTADAAKVVDAPKMTDRLLQAAAATITAPQVVPAPPMQMQSGAVQSLVPPSLVSDFESFERKVEMDNAVKKSLSFSYQIKFVDNEQSITLESGDKSRNIAEADLKAHILGDFEKRMAKNQVKAPAEWYSEAAGVATSTAPDGVTLNLTANPPLVTEMTDKVMDDRIKVSCQVYASDAIPESDATQRIAAALEKIAKKYTASGSGEK